MASQALAGGVILRLFLRLRNDGADAGEDLRRIEVLRRLEVGVVTLDARPGRLRTDEVRGGVGQSKLRRRFRTPTRRAEQPDVWHRARMRRYVDAAERVLFGEAVMQERQQL